MKKTNRAKVFSVLIFSLLLFPISLSAEEMFLRFKVDEKSFSVSEDDILVTSNKFGADDFEMKIFAGKDSEPSLTLTIPAEVSKPLKVPSGSNEAGNKISQGSVSLQNFPAAGDTLNSHDFMKSPKTEPSPDAITITSVETKGSEKIIKGTVNCTVSDSEASHTIKAEFQIKAKE